LITAEFALLDVLGDGVGGFLGGNLHLGLGHLGDLGDEVVQAAARLQRHVVPRRHGLPVAPGYIMCGKHNRPGSVVKQVGDAPCTLARPSSEASQRSQTHLKKRR
jgi:hypothetical protein